MNPTEPHLGTCECCGHDNPVEEPPNPETCEHETCECCGDDPTKPHLQTCECCGDDFDVDEVEELILQEAYEIAGQLVGSHPNYRTYASEWKPQTDDKVFYDANIACDEDDIARICGETAQQSGSYWWQCHRFLRISASRAHKILIKRNNFDALAAELSKERELFGQAAVNAENSLENRSKARNLYEEQHLDDAVSRCGLLIHPVQNWLCASPDGIVFGDPNRVLEVKCPIACREKPVISRRGKINLNYISRSTDGSLCLNSSHEYYTQCQILMYCAATVECDLYLYSKFDNHTVKVKRDEEFLKNSIPKLEHFYYSNYLPLLIEKHGRDSRLV